MSQALFVLAVNSRSVEMSPEEARARPARQRPSVTLLTTPDEAKLVAFAEAVGDIHLSLRNDLDQAYAEIDGADLTRLLEDYEAPEIDLTKGKGTTSLGGNNR